MNYAQKVSQTGDISEGGSIILAVSGFRTFTAGPSSFCEVSIDLKPQPSGGYTPRIVSTSTLDTSGGAGWDNIRFGGWDINGSWTVFTAQLNGTTQAAFSSSVGCLYYPATFPNIMGVTEKNFGDITIDDGSGNIITAADQDTNTLQNCAFKVPVAHTAIVRAITVQGSTEIPINWKIEYQLGDTNEWTVLAQGTTGNDIKVPFKNMTANTNIRARGTGSGTGGKCSAVMYIELHKPRT